MKKISHTLVLVLLLCMFPVSNVYAAGADTRNDSDCSVVYEFYDAIDKKDWERWVEQYTEFEYESQRGFINYEKAREERMGVFNIKSVKVLDTYEFDLNNPEHFALLLPYSNFYSYYILPAYGGMEMKVVLASLYMEVFEEDQFTRNGFTIHMEYLIKENGEWKYAGSSGAHLYTIEYAYPEGTRSKDISRLIEIINLRYNEGFWINMSGDMILIDYRDEFRPYGNFEDKYTYSEWLFSDVNEALWYGAQNQQVIKNAYEFGIIAGNGDGTFNPNGTLTVAQALKMAAVVHSTFNGKGGVFNQGTPWYSVYVDYAISNEIIKPDSFDNYDRVITRAEMAMVFANSVPADALPGINITDSIPDVDPTTRYYKEIFMLYNAGVLLGNDSAGTFRPNDGINRAEAAALIVRVANPYERKYVFNTD